MKMIQIFVIVSLFYMIAIAQNCADDILKVLEESSVENLKMIDASAKLPSGLMSGNLHSLGLYSQCQDVKSARFCHIKSMNSKGVPSPIFFDTMNPLRPFEENMTIPLLSFAVCVPVSCNAENVADAIESVVASYPVKMRHKYPLTALCELDLKISQDKGAIVVACLFALCGIIGVLMSVLEMAYFYRFSWSSVWEHLQYPKKSHCDAYLTSPTSEGGEDAPMLPYHRTDEPKVHGIKVPEIVKALSGWRNVLYLFEVKNTQFETDLRFIDGIRVLSILWVIHGHQYLWTLFLPGANAPVLIRQFRNLDFLLTMNAFFSVDSFFMIAGFLVSLFLWPKLKSTKSLSVTNIFQIFIGRYIRLTPTYIMIIMFQGYLAYYTVSGPVSFKLLKNFDRCKTQWWENILYLNNFKDASETCTSWGWYLSNDFQFFILSVSLLWIMSRRKVIGHLGFITLFTASTITCAVLAYKYNLQSLFLHPYLRFYEGDFSANIQTALDTTKYIYYKPWARIQAYLVGIYAGLYQTRYPNTLKKLESWKIILLLLFSFCLMTVALFGVYDEGLGKNITKTWHVTYISFSRTVWAMGLAIFLLVGIAGRAGDLGNFLSHGFWKPLAKLGLLTYLIHPMVLDVLLTSMEQPSLYSHTIFFAYYTGAVFFTFLFASAAYVFIELPVRNLSKMLIN